MKTPILSTAVLASIFISLASKAQVPCKAHADFSLVAEKVEENFYDKTMKGLNWTELKQKYLSALNCDSSDDQISQAINKLLAHLKTSHTALYTPRDVKYWSLKSIFSGDLSKFQIPFSGVFSDENYVRTILEGSSLYQSGIRSGDILRSINDLPFTDLGFPGDKYSTLKWSRKGAILRQSSIKPVTASMQTHFLNASNASERLYHREGKTVGYFHLWSGTHAGFLQSLEHGLRNFKNKKVSAIVIDLRDGHGGANPDYLKLIQTDKYLKKVPKFFIINDGVVSGKEWITAIIKRDHIGVLVGTKTAGAFMAGAPFNLLQERFFLYLAVEEFLPPGIQKIEGVGIEPDVTIKPCIKSCNGEDLQLHGTLNLAFKS